MTKLMFASILFLSLLINFAQLKENVNTKQKRPKSVELQEIIVADKKPLKPEIIPLNTVLGPNALVEAHANEEKAKLEEAAFRQRIMEMDYTAQDLGLNIQKFNDWLKEDEQRAENLIKIFVYLNRLDNAPICMTQDMLLTIDEHKLLHEVVKELIKDRTKMDEKKAQKVEKLVYIFGQDGVEQIFMFGEGIKCRESLEEPSRVGRLLNHIGFALFEWTETKALRQRKSRRRRRRHFAKDDEFQLREERNKVFEYLTTVYNKNVDKDKNPDHKFEKLVKKKLAKWNTFGHKLANITRKFKEYAIWAFAPSNIQYLITVILKITSLSTAFTISLEVARSFGIDELLNHEIDFLGEALIELGFARQAVMWIFDKNGVIPLYLRGNSVAEKKHKHNQENHEEKLEYVDAKGNVYTAQMLASNATKKEEQEEFLTHLFEAIMQRKRRPIDEIVGKAVNGLKDSAHKLLNEIHGKIEKARIMKIDIVHELKRFGNWLISPRHVNNIIKLLLTLTGAYTPIWISLEVLQYTGLTDVILQIMHATDHTLHEIRFFQQNPTAGTVVDFVLSEEGLIPQFFSQSQNDDPKKREMRVAEELKMFELIGNMFREHDGESLKKVYNFFLRKIKGTTETTELFQKWHKENEALNQKRRANLNWAKVRQILAPKNEIRRNIEEFREYTFAQIKEFVAMRKRTKDFDAMIRGNIEKCIPNLLDAHVVMTERDGVEPVVENCVEKKKENLQKFHKLENFKN